MYAVDIDVMDTMISWSASTFRKIYLRRLKLHKPQEFLQCIMEDSIGTLLLLFIDDQVENFIQYD